MVPRKPRNFLRLVVSCNVISLLTFGLVLVQLKCAAAKKHPPNANTSSLQLKAENNLPSCTPPQSSQGNLRTYCTGYTTIPTENVPRQHEVEHLDMYSDNNLGILTDRQLERAKLPKLVKLSLDHCKITEIRRGAFRGGTGLRHLSLKSNLIQSLDPHVFHGLIKLEALLISYNPIKSFQIGTVFPPLASLTDLDISYCKLSYIPDNTFDNVRTLKKLSLENNTLATLSWKIFLNFENFEHASLGYNPWNCDCQLRFLIEILSSLPALIFGCTISPDDKRYMNCPPQVEAFAVGNAHEERGDDVHLECTYSGYPPPTVKWLINGNPIETGSIKVKNKTDDLLRNLDEEEMKRNVRFKEVLMLRHAEANNFGKYTCFVENAAGQSRKVKFFKFNNKTVKSGMPVWLWVLGALIGTLVIIVLPLSIFLVRRLRQNKHKKAINGLVVDLNYIQETIELQHSQKRIDTNQRKVNFADPLLD